MRILAKILIVLIIGFVLGGLSASYLIQRTYGLGAINVGPWSAWPFVGGAEIDPYTIARTTADGSIPLGAAEGLTFEALTDSSGSKLRQACDYVVSGKTSTARLWTLAAYGPDGELVDAGERLVPAIFSGQTNRFPDGSFSIHISRIPQAGNWVPLGEKGEFRLVFRLYDTPITSNAGLIAPTMPDIERLGCR